MREPLQMGIRAQAPVIVPPGIEDQAAWLAGHVSTIERLAKKVAAVHGGHDARLVDASEEVEALLERLEDHLSREMQAILSRAELGAARFQETLRALAAEHIELGARLARLRTLCDGFDPPPGACNSYRALMAELRSLETRLLEHIVQEGRVLQLAEDAA